MGLRRRGHPAAAERQSAPPSRSSPTSAAGSAAPSRPCWSPSAADPSRARLCGRIVSAIAVAETTAIAGGEEEGALVAGERGGDPGQRRAEADPGVEERGEGAERGAAAGLGDAVDDDQRERRVEQREGGAHRQGAGQRDRQAVGDGDRRQAERLGQRRGDRHPRRPDPVGQVAADQAGEDDHRREGAEHGRAVADPAGVEVEDDEGGDRRVADRGEGERRRRAGPPRGRSAAGARARRSGSGRKGSGRRKAITAPDQRRRAGEDPDQRVAGGVQEQLADQRADAEPGPDGEAVEADHPAAPARAAPGRRSRPSRR